MTISLDIIIVNWNSGGHLKNCIASISIAKLNACVLANLFIVDNASTDNSLKEIERSGLPVTIIRNRENRGFAAACNQGALLSRSNYLLFLNPDTLLFESSLAVPLAFMEKPECCGIGICGIRLVDEEGNVTTSAARFPTLGVMAGKILGLNKLFPQSFPAHLMKSSELKVSCCVDQVIGAFFLMRRSVFDACHGFDEQFFVYFEEVDLSLRAKKLGYSSYIMTDVSAFHQGGGCSDNVKATRLFYSLRSRILYARKHYARLNLAALMLLTGVEFPLRLAKGLLKGSYTDIKNTVVGYAQFAGFLLQRDNQ